MILFRALPGVLLIAGVYLVAYGVKDSSLAEMLFGAAILGVYSGVTRTTSTTRKAGKR